MDDIFDLDAIEAEADFDASLGAAEATDDDVEALYAALGSLNESLSDTED